MTRFELLSCVDQDDGVVRCGCRVFRKNSNARAVEGARGAAFIASASGSAAKIF
jgi:hypothetical protein